MNKLKSATWPDLATVWPHTKTTKTTNQACAFDRSFDLRLRSKASIQSLIEDQLCLLNLIFVVGRETENNKSLIRIQWKLEAAKLIDYVH